MWTDWKSWRKGGTKKWFIAICLAVIAYDVLDRNLPCPMQLFDKTLYCQMVESPHWATHCAGPLVCLGRAKGRKVGIPYGSNPDTCPVRAMRAWLEGAAIESGPVFLSVTRHGKVGARMSGYAVALVVKRYAGASGLEPAAYIRDGNLFRENAAARVGL